MTESEIFDKFAQIVAKSLRFDASQIPPDIVLTDLDAESLDLIEITMETETQFHIFLQDKSILDTALQAFGPGVLEHDGYLTAEGKQLLLCRMPDADADTFVGQVAAKDFAELFSQSQHLGANAQGLAQYTPAECASCGGNIVPSMGLTYEMPEVREITVRSGEELDREWVREYYDKEYRPQAGPPVSATAVQ